MPKLYIFALCEKVITDKEERVSLITLFNNINAKILPSSKEVPSNAVAPKEWCAFAAWDIQPEDVGKEFRQTIRLIYPNGEQFGPLISVNFSPQAGKPRQNVTVNGMGFPIGREGPYSFRMMLEHENSTIFEAAPLIVNVTHEILTDVPAGFVSLT